MDTRASRNTLVQWPEPEFGWGDRIVLAGIGGIVIGFWWAVWPVLF